MIKIELADHYHNEINELFKEYIDMLIEIEPSFNEYLKLQNYNEEMEHLEKKYGLPMGRLYIIKVDDKIAGCIGLRKIDNKKCEMKRLYVRPKFRGYRLANQLILKIIDDAKKIGYKAMVLDTFPFLESAIHLYKKFGFYEIESYNHSPMDNLIYMQLDL